MLPLSASLKKSIETDTVSLSSNFEKYFTLAYFIFNCIIALTLIGGHVMTNQLIDIGRRLSALREIEEISGEVMAGKLGMTPGEYAEYEDGKKDFSFSFLHNAASILGVDILDIISGESPKLSVCTLVRKGQGYDIRRREAYSYKHLAFTFKNKKAEPFIVTVEPKPEESIVLHEHAGQEFNYMLSGTMKFFIGDAIHELQEGDSVYFDSGVPHAMNALNGKPAEFLAVVFN